jgi:hypothetical protein
MTRSGLPASSLRGAHGSDTVLSQRVLNRALLARQLLLRRERRSVPEMIEHLVGMQAQEPSNPYLALWSRLEDFQPDDLSQLLANRQAVRTTVMRGTIHLLTARDALALRPLMQPLFARILFSTAWGKNIKAVEPDELIVAGRELLAEQPRTRAELGPLLAERWPEEDPASLSWAVSYLVPVVQVPPRGLWGQSGQARLTTMESWLGRPLDPNPSIDRMVLRYLAAFGPATTGDIRTWSGVAGLRAVVDRLRPQLRTFRDERGRELFDLPDAPLPDPATPSPPRFLPEYDNIALSHDDRSRIFSSNAGLSIPEGRGSEYGSVLVDGFVRAMWRIHRQRDSARLVIESGATLSPGEQTAVAEEGDRFLVFVAADASNRDVAFTTPE